MSLQSRIKYGTTVIKGIEIPNYNMGDCSATNMTGFATNGTTAYCVKRNNTVDKATIYTINNYSNTSRALSSTKKVIPYATYGMACYNNNLYIASKGGKIVEVPINGSTTKTYTTTLDGIASGCQALTHYKGAEFILMANNFNEGTDFLCFTIGKFNATSGTFVETGKRFYVKNTGFTTLQDIYYDSTHGLFIVTNEKVDGKYTANNLILQVDMNRVDDTLHNGCPLYYPTAEYKFNGKAAQYTQLNVESIAMGAEDKKLYIVANVVPASGATDGFATDGLFYIGNFQFNEKSFSRCKIYFNSGVSVPVISGSITENSQTSTYACQNPGAFAVNGKTGYCLTTNTTGTLKDDVSMLLKTANIDTTAFTTVTGTPLRKMGHANGMCYYNNALYVAAYNKNTGSVQKDIVKLSLTGKELIRYKGMNGTSEIMVGGISHYEGNQFIALEYSGSYAVSPKFYIGTFNDSTREFQVAKTFRVTNPDHDPNASLNVLQDIHYDPKYGLFFITKTAGTEEHLYRVTPEAIKAASDSSIEVVPLANQYYFDNTVTEIESVCISGDVMYASNNASGNGDSVVKILTFTFL